MTAIASSSLGSLMILSAQIVRSLWSFQNYARETQHTSCEGKFYSNPLPFTEPVAWWLFIGWVGNIDYGAPPTYSHAVQTFTAGGGGGSPLQVRYLCLAHVIVNNERLQFYFDRGGCSSTRSTPPPPPPPPMDTPLLSYPLSCGAGWAWPTPATTPLH